MTREGSLDADGVLSHIDRGLVLDVAKELVNTPSPTGEEGALATVLERIFREVGCRSWQQQIYGERSNVIGELRGTGGGPTTLMSGHMDTSVRGDEEYLVGRGFKNSAVVEGERIYGNGVVNMKQALVSYVAAVDALQRAGVKLRGNIILAGTAGEIELAAVDEFQGKNFDAYGMGLRYLLIHGITADFQFLGEPTGHRVHIGMMGTIWAKITTHGDFAHTAFSDHHVNAIEEMWSVWRGLDAWIEAHRESSSFMGVPALVNRAAVRGGLPWRAARTPNVCYAYVDVRFAPTTHPIDAQREFTSAVGAAAASCRYPVDVDYYMSRPGTLLPADSPPVKAVTDAHRAVTGVSLEPRLSPPLCTDAIDANRLGVPTIVYGSGGIASSGVDPRAAEGESVTVGEMVTAAAVYALAAIELDRLTPDEVVTARGPMPGVTLPREKSAEPSLAAGGRHP
ncbi:MAG TPA: M20/M25/M40 family metallo-hydrolase [Gemmatimonadaceae bacterium]|nr:M20/M25/M40 family metallo-hydrolase [Gemmatimonadaceae bacterium]